MRLLKFGFVVAFLSSLACMTAPYDQQTVAPHTAITFDGFASAAGMQVNIQAFNKRTSQWVTIRTVVASTTPTTISGDTLYRFTTSVTFTALANWQCYWGSPGTCTIPPGSAGAQVRAQQSNGSLLTTFDANGISCVIDKLNAGEGWMAAGFACRDDNSPVVNLRWIT